jgi:hypothetical protein
VRFVSPDRWFRTSTRPVREPVRGTGSPYRGGEPVPLPATAEWFGNQGGWIAAPVAEAPDPGSCDHETPLEGDDGLAAWERRLERVCPRCGQRAVGDDGICTSCGASKRPATADRTPLPLPCSPFGERERTLARDCPSDCPRSWGATTDFAAGFPSLLGAGLAVGALQSCTRSHASPVGPIGGRPAGAGVPFDVAPRAPVGTPGHCRRNGSRSCELADPVHAPGGSALLRVAASRRSRLRAPRCGARSSAPPGTRTRQRGAWLRCSREVNPS